MAIQKSANEIVNTIEKALYIVLKKRKLYEKTCFAKKYDYDSIQYASKVQEITEYVNGIMAQVRNWVHLGNLNSLILIIRNPQKQVVEKWSFCVVVEKSRGDTNLVSELLNQVYESKVFLPPSEDNRSFEIYVNTSRDSSVPGGWEDSNLHEGSQFQQVKLQELPTAAFLLQTYIEFPII